MTIELFGEIVSDEWAWLYELFDIPCCCPGQVREGIRGLGEGEELIVEINSPGGSVWAGFEIYGLLQACKNDTEAHVIAMAASAATTIMCGCDLALASPVAQIMIHQPLISVDEPVNNETARQLQNFLDSVKASILNGYVLKCGGKTSRARLEQLVDESTWMPTQDALALGLIDGYLDTGEEAGANLTAGGGILVNNAAGLSQPPAALLARYEAAVRAGAMPEVSGHPVRREAPLDTSGGPTAEDREAVDNLIADWRLMASIELERARYEA